MEGNMVFVYGAIAIFGLLFLESMTRILRYLTIAIIALMMYFLNNPDVLIPDWLRLFLP